MTDISNISFSEFSNPQGFEIQVSHDFEFNSHSADNFLENNNSNKFDMLKEFGELEKAYTSAVNTDNFTKHYTECVGDLNIEYGDKLNAISRMDVRAFCAAKVGVFDKEPPIIGDAMSAMAKSGLDGYVNFLEGADTFDSIKNADSYLSNLEDKYHGKTLTDIANGNHNHKTDINDIVSNDYVTITESHKNIFNNNSLHDTKIDITDPNYISKTFDNNLNDFLSEQHKINLPNPFNDETLNNAISEVSKTNHLEPICPIGSDICNNENIIHITRGLEKHPHIDFGGIEKNPHIEINPYIKFNDIEKNPHIEFNGIEKNLHIDTKGILDSTSFDFRHNHTLDPRIVPDSFNFNSGHNHSFDNVVQHELPSLNTMIDQNLNNFLDNHNSGITIASF